jgi:hypothetical protein
MDLGLKVGSSSSVAAAKAWAEPLHDASRLKAHGS